jgi:hypothetical protein
MVSVFSPQAFPRGAQLGASPYEAPLADEAQPADVRPVDVTRDAARLAHVESVAEPPVVVAVCFPDAARESLGEHFPEAALYVPRAAESACVECSAGELRYAPALVSRSVRCSQSESCSRFEVSLRGSIRWADEERCEPLELCRLRDAPSYCCRPCFPDGGPSCWRVESHHD